MMIKFTFSRLLGIGPIIRSTRFNLFSTSASLQHIGLWRKKRGLEYHYTDFGPLTNRPDYSYVDGRPVPVSSNLRKRLDKQQEYARKIVQMNSDIDFAKERYLSSQRAHNENRRNILKSKLKPKGEALLKGRKQS